MKRITYLFPNALPKALTMSYDDGVVEDRQLIGIFNRHGIRGTFHINSGLFGRPGRLAASDVPQLYTGHEVACHWVTHPFPDHCPKAAMLQEVVEDRRSLEKILKRPIRGMSYPMGSYTRETLEVLAAADIAYSRTVLSTGKFAMPQNWLEWHPTCHHRENVLEKGEAFRRDPYEFRLFYVWGHAYEFERNHNWELIEEFCASMARQKNIWYATNIEIHDYVEALHRLEFSVDCNLVHNPGAGTLWLRVDDNTVEIAPGATCEL